MKRFAFLVLLALGGCSATLSGLPQLAPEAAGQLDATVNAVILQKAMDIHNLGIALQQIQETPGMVSSVPVVMSPAPAPTPVPVKPVGGTLPLGPTSNG